MNQYKVKLRGEQPMIVVGNIILFDKALPLNRKDITHYFNVDDVISIIDISNEKISDSPPYQK
ncbi:hypothetical protein [Bacillus sp. D48C]